ncbi:MAG TPA: hypothetical protein DD435_13445 [Cyanobacteria bacterium UBA8530]|nr:hypothetical protein [Cyanobacteria bacterium UBA8530]
MKINLATTLALILATGISLPMLAESTSAETSYALDLNELLNPTITAATKRAQRARSAPATIYVVTEDDIKSHGYLDLVDALRNVPGISMSSNWHSEYGNSRMIVRGIPGNDKIALLVNGRRIGFSARVQKDVQYANNFPLAMVKRIEVAFGPASALYGADALSAVVNIITKDGVEAKGGSLTSSYGLVGTTNDNLSYGAPIDGKSSLMVFGRFYHGGGENIDNGKYDAYAKTSADRQYWPGSKERDLSQTSHNAILSYRNEGFSVDYIRSYLNGPAVGAGKDVTYASNDMARWITSNDVISMGYDAKIGETKSTTTLSYENFLIDPSSRYVRNNIATAATTDPATRSAYVDAYKFGTGRGLHVEQTMIHDFSEDLNVVGGLTIENLDGVPKSPNLSKELDTTRSINDQGYDKNGALTTGSIIHYGQYQNYGAYLQTELGYIPKLKTTIGARYDYNTRYKPTFNPRLGLVYTMDDATTLKALYGTAYLAPTLFQNYNVFGAPGGLMAVANPNQRPQLSKTGEFSVLRSFGSNLNVTATFFQNDMTDLLMDQRTEEVVSGKKTTVQTIVNMGSSLARGADVRLDSFLFDQRAYLGASYVNANFTSTGQEGPMPDVVNTILNSGIDLRPLSWLSINPQVLWYSGRTTTKNNSDYKGALMSGMLSMDLGARAAINSNLAITLTGSNLLDQISYGDGEEAAGTLTNKLPQDGRRLLLGMNYTF